MCLIGVKSKNLILRCFKYLASLFMLVILTTGDSFFQEQRAYFFSPHPTELFQVNLSQADDDLCNYKAGLVGIEMPLLPLSFKDSWIFFSNFVATLLKFQLSVFFSIKELLSEIYIPILEISLKELP